MHRRDYLGVGVGTFSAVAGCLRLPDGGTPEPVRSIGVIDRDPPPDPPITPDISVRSAEATETGPPELVASVENSAEYPIEVGEERAIVFAFVSSEERPGLTLLPIDGEYPAVEPGCWRLAEPIAIAEYYGVVALDPGEVTERRIGVWGSPDGDGCLPTGEFRFTTTYAGARDRGEGLEEQEWRGDWGFTLRVS